MIDNGSPHGTSGPVGQSTPAAPDDTPAEGVVRVGEWIGIGNEFTGVRVRKVWTRNGERLELRVPARGYTALLDAMQLEIVAAQDPEKFTALFRRRLGSDEEAGGDS